MRIKLAYGRSGLWVDLPDETTVIEPRFEPGLADEAAAIRRALAAPLDCRPLAEIAGPDDTVAIVFSDLTRPMPSDRALPPLLAVLAEAGVPDEHITLINALGTHRAQTEAELRGMLGDALVDRYRIVQHNAWDDASMEQVGTNRLGHPVLINREYMAASVRILTGFIEPHFFAGFSGGPKAVLPGIANIQAILDNHNPEMIGHPRATWAVTEGNPLWEEMLAAARLAAPSFVLNVTVNRERQITGVFAGELLASHRAGCAFVRRTALQPVAEPFDIVVTSNSGYPLDLNLYQALKGMVAAGQVVRSGGHIIAAAECWDGVPSHGEYGKLLAAADSPQRLLDMICAPGFSSHDQWQVQVQAQLLLHAVVHVYASGLSDEDICRAHMLPCHSIEETLAALRRQNPAARVAVLPEGPQTVPYLDEV